MVGIIDGAVVLLDVRHQVSDEVETEHIFAETSHWNLRQMGHHGQQLVGVTIRQYDDHLLRLAFCEKVVEDIVHTPYLVIDLLSVCGAAN